MVPVMILVGHSGFPFYIRLVSVSFPDFSGHWNWPELYVFGTVISVREYCFLFRRFLRPVPAGRKREPVGSGWKRVWFR